MESTLSFDVSRRHFLKWGAMTALALSTVSTTALLTGCAQRPMKGLLLLREQDVVVLRAIIPVVLKGALPDAQSERQHVVDALVADIDQGFAGMPLAAARQVRQLFDLLTFAPTRLLMTGVGDWSQAPSSDIEHFLVSWRNSGSALKMATYNLFTQLPLLTWYKRPESWASIGYEKPVRILDV